MGVVAFEVSQFSGFHQFQPSRLCKIDSFRFVSLVGVSCILVRHDNETIVVAFCSGKDVKVSKHTLNRRVMVIFISREPLRVGEYVQEQLPRLEAPQTIT